MPEMTALPILPSAPPSASSSSSVSSNLVAHADKTRAANPTATLKSAGPRQATGAAPDDDASSFASVLQRQLEQAAAIPLPLSAAALALDGSARPLPDAALVIEAIARPLPDAALVLDGNAEPLPDATLVIEAIVRPLPDAALVLDGNAKPLPDATLVLDANTKPLPAAALATELTPAGEDLSARLDDSQKKSDDIPVAIQTPYLLAPATLSGGKPETDAVSSPVTEKKSAVVSDNALQLAATAAALAQSHLADSQDAAPNKLAEMPQAAASKTAEFAGRLTFSPDAVSPHANSGESTSGEAGFENLLAAAQAASSSRNAAVHSPSHNTPSLPVHTPVGAHGWDGEVSDKLVWMVGRQEQRAELVLNPPQLGRVEVSLSISGGETTALFVSSNPAVRDALEAALPRLREILADAGVNLGQAQVGADAGSNQATNQSTNQRENWDNPGRATNRYNSANDLELLHPVEATQWFKQGNGLVDVFV